MARQLRLDDPGCFWHITSRGNAKADIVLDDEDRRRFIDLLGNAVTRFHWILYAYALMTNHFHLVLETTQPTLSSGMHWLNAAYAQAFNRRHERVGHVFQGRFKAFLVDKENYFLEVLRYVVLNPVRAGMVATPDDCRWTSYPATVGETPAPDWLPIDRVLINFGGDTPLARTRFRHFVAEGLGVRIPWQEVVGQMYLGDEEWVDETRKRVESRPRSDDHPLPQRDLRDIRMADVIGAVSHVERLQECQVRHGRGGTARMMAAWIGSCEAHRPLREIAAALNVRSVGHVSRMIAACDRELRADASLQQRTDETVRLLPAWRKGKGKM